MSRRAGICALAVPIGVVLTLSGACFSPGPPPPLAGGSMDAGGVDPGGSGVGGSGGLGGSGGGGPACETGYECVPGPESGTYVLRAGPCGAGTTAIELLTCDQCCAAPEAPCTVQGAFYSNYSCGNTPLQTFDAAGCTGFTDTSTARSIEASVTAGTCQAVPGEPATNGCRLDEVMTCGPGAVCLPAGQPVCILINDGEPCPTGYSPTAIQQGGSCGCGCGLSGEQCPPEVRLYSDNACTQNEVVVPVNGACMELPGPTTVRAVSSPSSGVACQSSASPTGATGKLCCPP